MSFDVATFQALSPTRELGRTCEHHPVLDSTSAHLRRRLRGREVSHGHLAIAELQTAGYGQQGRAWLSEPGNLFFSLVLERPLPSLTLAAGVALAETLRPHAPEVGLKWVNDLVARGAKLGGILAEAGPDGVVLGVGLNLVAQGHPGAIALAALGRVPPREALLAGMLGRLEEWLDELAAHGPAQVHARWCALSATLGTRVRGVHAGREVVGLAEGLAPSGGLVVRLDGGEGIELVSGSIRAADGGYA